MGIYSALTLILYEQSSINSMKSFKYKQHLWYFSVLLIQVTGVCGVVLRVKLQWMWATGGGRHDLRIQGEAIIYSHTQASGGTTRSSGQEELGFFFTFSKKEYQSPTVLRNPTPAVEPSVLGSVSR